MTSQMKGDDNKVGKETTVPQSYKGMTLEEARLFLRSIMDLFQSLAAMTDLKTMYEAGKQLSRLYFDCASHQRELAEILLELEFPEYAIKTMKKLNNMGVFKNDDIWFSSFYFYNICWNYSDASFEFATALGLCGLPNLLNLNIGHKPYLDNLSSRNVYYLIKASLSIIHNICRYPGSCTFFRADSVKASLVNLVRREEDFIRVVASLCLASVVSEGEVTLLSAGSGSNEDDVLASIVSYVTKARASDRGRFMGFRSHELLQGVRAATTTECERRHLVSLDGGLAMVRDGLVATATTGEDDVAECLQILCNLSMSEDTRAKILQDPGCGPEAVRVWTKNECVRVRMAAQEYLWCLDTDQTPTDQTLDTIDTSRPLPVYISYAAINRFAVLKIRDRLATDTTMLTLVDSDDDSVESVKRAIRKSALTIVCVSEAYKCQPRHQLEVQYCDRLARTILPLLIQQKYRPDGWIQHLLDRDSTAVFDLSSKRDFESAWETFTGSLATKVADIKADLQRKEVENRVKQEKLNEDERQRLERHNCLEDMSRSQHEPIPTTQMDGIGYRRYNGTENNVDDTRAKGPPDQGYSDPRHHQQHIDLNNVSSNSAWLDRHGLGHLRTQLAWFDMNLLRYYKNMKIQAPEYFYQTLEKQLKLDFVDILKFSNAINHL